MTEVRHFKYTSGARPIAEQARYRAEPHGPFGPCLIQFDPRVARGLAMVRHHPKGVKPSSPVTAKTRVKQTGTTLNDPSLSAIDGRDDRAIQTNPYLQIAEEKVVPATIGVQTEALKDRPYVPVRGNLRQPDFVDREVQVDSDLWSFDFEVQVLSDLLVRSAIEQSWLEVQSEAELLQISKFKAACAAERAAEVADLQRLEEAERRKRAERERRERQRADEVASRRALFDRVAAAGFASSFASKILMDVETQLDRAGWFYDEVEAEIRDRFLVWLFDEIRDVDSRARLIKRIKDGVILAACQVHRQRVEERVARDASAFAREDSERLASRRDLQSEDAAASRVRSVLLDHVKRRGKREID